PKGTLRLNAIYIGAGLISWAGPRCPSKKGSGMFTVEQGRGRDCRAAWSAATRSWPRRGQHRALDRLFSDPPSRSRLEMGQ
ncbi:MAG: hypothetical protein JJU31_16590, partial [Wenzhouxiangella sp.]|nr:hypothetical protein [Wenzhouxiangella sp.]